MLSLTHRHFIGVTCRLAMLLAVVFAAQACKQQGPETGTREAVPPPQAAETPEVQATTPPPAQTPAVETPAPQAPQPAAVAGNLLVNGDFSDWQNNWLARWNKDPWGKVQVTPTDQKYNDKPVVRFVPPADGIGVLFQTVPVEQLQARPGDTFKASVSLRAEAPDAVLLVLYGKVRTAEGERDVYLAEKTYFGNGEWTTLETGWSPGANIQGLTEIRFCVWAKENSTKPIDVANAGLELARGAGQ
ncbi:MAG: hypothetical protein ABFD69_07455 [Candidatus Sumerlaeia bacterium]